MRLFHGSRDDPLEVGADHAVLGGRRRQPLEPRQLPLGLPADVLGQLGLLDLLAQLVDLRLGLVLLAQLSLDRLQLLAQEVLALGLVHLGLDLGLDLRAELHHLELAREDLREAPQPLGDVALLEQLLLLLDLDAQRPRDHVAERLGVVDVGDRDLKLLGQVGNALDDGREGCLDVARERLELGRELDDVGLLVDARDQVRARST